MTEAAQPRDSSARRGGGRSRVGLIFAAIGAVIVGGAVYLFAVYLPGQQRAAAQAEITAWESRLAAARECLLGPALGSSSTREALAIRELSPDPWNRGTCTQLIGKLSRGETEDTGFAAVEETWRRMDSAAGKVAAAFLSHVDPAGEPAQNRRDDALPVALDELDGVHAELRKAAGMGPPPVRGGGKPLPAAQVIPLRHGNAPVTSLESWTMPAMSSIIAFGRTTGGEVQIALSPGAAPASQPVAAGVLRTVPDAPWGAGSLAIPSPTGDSLYQIVVGALNDGGGLVRAALGDPGKPADPAKAAKAEDAVTVDGNPRVFAVTGTAADGLVVAGGRNSLVLVRSQAGKLAADKPVEIEQLAFAVDPSGRTLVAYNGADGMLHGFIARGGAAGKMIDLGATNAGGACLTSKRGWVAGDASDQVVAFDDAGYKEHTWPKHDLLGCTADAALLHKRGASHYVVCADECRVAVLEGMRPSKVGTLAGDQVVAVAVRDQVLGVWREKGPPVYYATGGKLDPKLATSDGKVIDIVAEGKDGVVIVRVPAK